MLPQKLFEKVDALRLILTQSGGIYNYNGQALHETKKQDIPGNAIRANTHHMKMYTQTKYYSYIVQKERQSQ